MSVSCFFFNANVIISRITSIFAYLFKFSQMNLDSHLRDMLFIFIENTFIYISDICFAVKIHSCFKMGSVLNLKF